LPIKRFGVACTIQEKTAELTQKQRLVLFRIF
jgi:hypothetical protein